MSNMCGCTGSTMEKHHNRVCDYKTQQYPLFRDAVLFNAAVISPCSISQAPEKKESEPRAVEGSTE